MQMGSVHSNITAGIKNIYDLCRQPLGNAMLKMPTATKPYYWCHQRSFTWKKENRELSTNMFLIDHGHMMLLV